MWPNMQCNAVDLAVEYETMWLSVDSANYGNYFHELCGIRKLPHFGIDHTYIDVFRNDFYYLFPFCSPNTHYQNFMTQNKDCEILSIKNF